VLAILASNDASPLPKSSSPPRFPCSSLDATHNRRVLSSFDVGLVLVLSCVRLLTIFLLCAWAPRFTASCLRLQLATRSHHDKKS